MIIKIGCEAYIVRDGQVLLGLRGHAVRFGAGTWALPGGHMKPLERADATIVRELKEEMDITITPADLELLALTDDVQPQANVYYAHITFRVNIGSQEPKQAEPDMCAEWRWFPENQIPEPLFFAHRPIFATIRSGKTYLNQE